MPRLSRVLATGFLLFLAPSILVPNSHAGILQLPPSLFQEALSESVATAFEPRSSADAPTLRLEDFEWVWDGTPIEGVDVNFQPGSLEWVRVGDVLAFPRARVSVQIKDATSGMMKNQTLTQPFLPEGSTVLRAEFPVVLVSGKKNALSLKVVRNGKELTGTLLIRYSPKDPARANPIFIDASCSSENAIAFWKERPRFPAWVYVGCRLTRSNTSQGKTSNLELYLFWDVPDAQVRVQGNPVDEAQPSFWLLKLRPDPTPIRIESSAGALELTHQSPKRIRNGSFGAGVGPYSYHFQSPGIDTDTTAAIVTMYASYTITDTMRLTAFNATTLHKNRYMDTGVYFNSESLRALDRRLSLNVMLGANAVGFSTGGVSRFKLGAPQGFEATYRDAFGRNWNLSSGAFLYPKINDKSYYNLWVRYGKRGMFIEANFISIHDEISSIPFVTRSFGVSFGMPIFQFM